MVQFITPFHRTHVSFTIFEHVHLLHLFYHPPAKVKKVIMLSVNVSVLRMLTKCLMNHWIFKLLERLYTNIV